MKLKIKVNGKTKNIVSDTTPIGTIISYMGTIEPKDYLFCKALDCDDPVAYVSENYEEITQEEFKELYYGRMKSVLESAIEESKNEEQSL